jgi:transketolase
VRASFISTLTELAKNDPRIVLLTGDLGYLVIEQFALHFPDRFINVGVAEQNMVGIATGLAEAGFIPFIYSIVTFAVLRPYEFFRNGPIFHQFPVRLIGVGGGLEYANNGATHYGLEDVGVMRVQNGVQVIAPADAQQARSALLATWNLPGPVYYRLGKDDKAIVPGLDGRFELDHAQVIRKGTDVLFITLGNIATEAVRAAEILSAQGIESSIAIVPSLNPGPVSDLITLLSQFHLAVTVEAHNINCGLGSLVAEIIAENTVETKLIRCGVRKVPDGISGNQEFLYKKYGLSGKELADLVIAETRKPKRKWQNRI